MSNKILNLECLKETLKNLGDLHDVFVENIFLDSKKQTISMLITDFLTNYEGLPGYTAALKGVLHFQGVDSLQANFEQINGSVRIYEASIYSDSDRLGVLITFTPSGRFTIRCENICFPDELTSKLQMLITH
jgi:hypothetical protein